MKMKYYSRFGILAFAILMAVATQSRATMYDLSTAGSSSVVNGATFMTVDIAPTGTGNINSFVRLQAPGTEQGYNTDVAKQADFPYDEKYGTFTHSLLLSSVPTVQLTAGGTWFYEFGLDVDQGGSHLLSLDGLKIFRESVGNLTVPVENLGTPIYNLDGPGSTDNWIKLDSSLGAGSGQGDMYAYIPVSLFSAGTGNYVYLYSRFGDNVASNGGPEEWFVREGSTQPPEPPRVPAPAAVLLGMFGLTTAGWRLRKFA